MATPIIPPLHWREGMFLRPHHFQHLQRQLGQHLAFLLDAEFPHRWGVLRLVLDERVLSTGTFRLAECACVLRDGLIVTDDLLARPLELDLKPSLEALRGKHGGIFLAVPRPARAEVVDFTSKVPPDEGLPRRYRPVAREAVDLNTGENPQAIDCVALNARLLPEGEDLSGYECLKIAEVIYREDSFQRNADYCPPTILALEGSPLHRCSTEVLATLQEGARFVLGIYTQDSSGQREAATFETRLKLNGLLSSAPHLEGLLGSGAARPIDLYLALCRVLGGLVGLQADAEELIPKAVARYNHEDLAGTFKDLRERIDTCLKSIVPRKYPQFPFRKSGEQDFQLEDFRQEWLASAIFIAAHSARSLDDTKAWLDNCLIGAPGALSGFRQKRILGLERKRVEDPPPEIGLKRDWVLYRLSVDPKIHGPLLAGIKDEGKLAVRAGWQSDTGIAPPQGLKLVVKMEEGPARSGKTDG